MNMVGVVGAGILVGCLSPGGEGQSTETEANYVGMVSARTVEEAPEGVDPVPYSAIDNEYVRSVVKGAAAAGDGSDSAAEIPEGDFKRTVRAYRDLPTPESDDAPYGGYASFDSRVVVVTISKYQ